MEQLILTSQTIGNAAFEALQAASHGQATGQTSGGVFLRTQEGWVLFLSFATWRGPLTINLPPVSGEGLSIDPHSPFLIQESSINFPEENIKIEFGRAEHWSPPPRPAAQLPQAERVQRLERVIKAVTASIADRGGPGVDSISNTGALFDPGSSELSAARAALVSLHPNGILAPLADWLGSGPGLTPAGDDLVVGFLLALNRWGDRLLPDLPPEPLNRVLSAAARQRTTALSASLIECAAAGLAHERLVAALDGLVSGNLTEDRIVDHFLSWGHTSGAAALQGMGLVVDLMGER